MNISTLNTLVKAGLDEKKAQVYLILLEQGESTMPEILPHSSLSRATVYDILPELMAEEFVNYRKEGRTAYYSAVHPNKIFSLLEEKKRQMSLLEGEVDTTVQSLAGMFQLANSKPGVRFFEGPEGIEKALESIAHTFVPDTEVYSYVKVKTRDTEKTLDGALSQFIDRRRASNVTTLVIAVDSEEARAMQSRDEVELRTTRLIDQHTATLDFPGGEILIYGNTICTVTAEGDAYVAFTVSSPAMAQMMKIFFLAQWDNLA
jgi:sugar-specific transcriptional regulator TrmB